jgi:hypothetical protein
VLEVTDHEQLKKIAGEKMAEETMAEAGLLEDFI